MDNKSQSDNLYLILAGIFIASLVSCNLIFQKFFEFKVWLPFIGYYTFQQSVGLLVYPITFLVTDIISEIYGMKKADRVVITGLIASFFMLLIVTISNHMTATPWSPVDGPTFSKVFGLSGAAVFASMVAYLFAQFIDVRVFHFWKILLFFGFSQFWGGVVFLYTHKNKINHAPVFYVHSCPGKIRTSDFAFINYKGNP